MILFSLKIITFCVYPKQCGSGIRRPVSIYFLIFIFIYLAVPGLVADHRIVDLRCGMEDL